MAATLPDGPRKKKDKSKCNLYTQWIAPNGKPINLQAKLIPNGWGTDVVFNGTISKLFLCSLPRLVFQYEKIFLWGK